MNEYIDYFNEINTFLDNNFSEKKIEFKIVGYTALALAGLEPTRGTKDIDTLKTEIFNIPENNDMTTALESEFGIRSPGSFRHGTYLDFVSTSIIWLPPKPKFIDYLDESNVRISYLSPTDVCVTKAFAYCKNTSTRSNDKNDVLEALNKELVSLERLVNKIDKSLPVYETHAEAPEVFPKIFELTAKLAKHSDSRIKLSYVIPEWMNNA